MRPMTVPDSTPSAEPFPPGYRLRRWIIEAELAPLRMGRAYKARDPDTGLAVVINTLSAALGDVGAYRFARACERAAEQHVDGLHELGEHLGTLYVVVAYLEGIGAAVDVGDY